MQFSLDTAEVFVPDGSDAGDALAKTTHLAVGAHQDDLEIMAFSGVMACFQREDRWFTGVVVTNGSGSPRDDVYKDYDDATMRAVRMKEQKKAAVVGEYAAQVLLDFPSGQVKDGAATRPIDDLEALLRACKPEVVYTHNLADKHDTHIGVTLKLLAALRRLDASERPKRVLGCEVWRDLDWMCDGDKVILDTSAHENLQAALLGVFDSQIAGGKRYDLATLGRRRAHATYFASHSVDACDSLNFAMDLAPLIADDSLDPADYVAAHLDRFREEVLGRIGGMQ